MVKIRNFLSAYRKVILSLICFCGLAFFSGCQQSIFTIHTYDGEHLSEDKLAKITKEKREQTGWEKLLSIYPCSIGIKTFDNKNPRDYQKGFMVFAETLMVLPGTHTYGITFAGPGSVQAGLIPGLIAGVAEEMKYGRLGTEFTFNSEAGHEYIIRFKEETKPWKGVVSVSYWVEDVNSGEILVGEKPSEPD